MNRTRLALALVLVAVVLTAALLLLLNREYDSPALGESLLSQLRSDTLEVEADGFRLHPLTGLEMQGLRLRSLLPDGEISMVADRVVVTHRLGSIFSGNWVFDEIVLQEPAIEVVWTVPEGSTSVSMDGAGASQSPPAASSGAGPGPAPEGDGQAEAAEEPSFRLALRRLGIEDGTFVMRDQGAEATTLEIDDLGVELRDLGVAPGATNVLTGLMAHGELTAAALRAVDMVSSTDVRGRLKLGDGHVRLEDLHLPMEVGVINLKDVDVDLEQESLHYTVEMAGEPLATHRILGASSGFGDASLSLELDGVGTDPIDATGRGILSIDAGQIGDVPVIMALERLLVGTDLVGQPYEAFQSNFQISNGALEVLPCEIRAGELAFGLQGAAGFDGWLDLKLELSLPRNRADIDELPKEALDALTGDDGRVRLPIVLGGTTDSPKVNLDQTVLKQILTNSLVREAEEELGKALGKLLGGN